MTVLVERGEIAPARLRDLLSFDMATGVFTWKVKRSNVHVGDQAGCVGTHGYQRIRVDGRIYQAHRLAWLWVYGRWPNGEIDHIDGQRANNAISNLRVATSSQNRANTSVRPGSRSGLKGVKWHSQRKRWNANITVGRKQISLGMFDSAKDAHQAYCTAAKEPFGEYARAA